MDDMDEVSNVEPAPEEGWCFECLEQRLLLDFPRHLPYEEEQELPPFFCYGVPSSETALPWGNSAIIQLPSNNATPTSFRLVRHFNSTYSPRSLSPSIVSDKASSEDGGQNDTGSIASSFHRIVKALAPTARTSTTSYSFLQQLTDEYLSGLMEDHILGSISFSSNHKSNLPSTSLRHPNLVPLLAILKSLPSVYLVFPYFPLTLQSLIYNNPNHFPSSWAVTFLFYQLLSAVDFLHSFGVIHGNISPSNVILNDSSWLWLSMFDESSTSGLCSCNGIYADLFLSTRLDWHTQFRKWWNGELSNFEYLLVLNRLAGRRWEDHSFHIVMPWVIDFSVKPDDASDCGWRDLTKSKWRLAKGDEQLDFTYSSSEVPHHLSDECLSDLAVCSYKARRLPLSVLRKAVRSVYEPNEYPASMQRLYQWTPDECIPEFYYDSRIFYSLHPGMADLAVPLWAANPEEFIKLHRDALESDRVSCNIHHWIDITFGYKMSGEAALAAKNVMLPSSELKAPKGIGRRQLFTSPHPQRRIKPEKNATFLPDTGYLQELEEACKFSENSMSFSPKYCEDEKKDSNSCCKLSDAPEDFQEYVSPYNADFGYIVENMDLESNNQMGFQELLNWRKKASYVMNEDYGKDLFSVGCILAELCLKRPLFNATTLPIYLETGEYPALMEELSPQTRAIVEACIDLDWTMRPTARSILESPYFSSTVKLSYLFIAPLQILAKDGTRLQFAADSCKKGILKAMGSNAAEMCAPYCLPLVRHPQTELECEWAYEMLQELIKRLRPEAVKSLVLPEIVKILQTASIPHLKVLLLQSSLVQDLWKSIGKQAYLELLHPVILSVLSSPIDKSPALAASVLLICTSEDLGIPVTINQTILPLINCFGKGLCADGIDTLVRIGGLFGDNFIVKHMIPLLTKVLRFCINVSRISKMEPTVSWCSLTIADCLTTIDGLTALLPVELVLKELVEDGTLLHKVVLMQKNIDISALQVAASTLLAMCQRIGSELTASHVLPQLKELFDEIAFSQEDSLVSNPSEKSSKAAKSTTLGIAEFECRMDIILIYRSLAFLLGIERLRQSCTTWLLLEQYLLRFYGWKWECSGEQSRSMTENPSSRKASPIKALPSEDNPTKLLLNGVGWSIPQSQSSKAAKNLTPKRNFTFSNQNLGISPSLTPREPWFWFPAATESWEENDFSGRSWNLKDELPWKIKASVIFSIRAHNGALRSIAVGEDESSVYTAGIGSEFKGVVQRWELSRLNSMIGYYAHEEVVNDICELSSNGRVASCDGTIHIWNSLTGKAISVFSEPSFDPTKFNSENGHSSSSKTISNTLFTNSFDGNLYTCMHLFRFSNVLLAGTDNGSVRFIDVSHGQVLHLWKGEYSQSSFPPLVSTICSSPSWIAVGLSSGHCRLFDARSGNLISNWKAHDGYVTKVASPDGNLLISSSFDKTLRVWDLRRDSPMQPVVFKGHVDGLSGFCVWGHDVISICRNKIGLSSLRKPFLENGQLQILPQNLYFSEHGIRNISPLTSIGILPFSRTFAVGTEDGYLRICC